MHKIALSILLTSLLNLLAREKDEPVSLRTLPLELQTEIALETVKEDSAESETKEREYVDWVELFKHISHLRQINKHFAQKLFRELGDAHKLLTVFISPESPLFATLRSIFSSGEEPTAFQKKVLTIASSTTDVPEACSLLADCVDQKNWPIAVFAASKIPKASVGVALPILQKAFLADAPLHVMCKMLLKKDPTYEPLQMFSQTVGQPRGQNLEKIEDFLCLFFKQFPQNDSNISKTIAYFLEHYPFSDVEKAFISKICSSTQEEADALAQDCQLESYGIATRCLAFFAAITTRSLSLAQLFVNKIPDGALGQAPLFATLESAPDIFNHFFHLIRHILTTGNRLIYVGAAFQFQKMDMIDVTLAISGLPLERQTNSSLFLKACLRKDADRAAAVDALLENPQTNSIPPVFIQQAAGVMVENNDKSLLEIVLKKTPHDFIEETLIPQAMSLGNVEMVHFLRSHLAQVHQTKLDTIENS